jgi:hypothetical protein
MDIGSLWTASLTLAETWLLQKTTRLCNRNSLHVKVKNGIFVPAHAMKSYKMKWGIAPRALNFGARTEVTNFTPRPLYSVEKKIYGTHWTEERLGPTAGLGVLKERISPALNRNRTWDRPAHRLATVPTVLPHTPSSSFSIYYVYYLLNRHWSPPSLLQNWYRVSFLGVKRPGRGVDHRPHLAQRFKKE